MTFDVAAVFADAWQMWKRDRELLLAVAGFFLFLPQFAAKLLIPVAPEPAGFGRDAAALKSWLVAYQAWLSNYGVIILVLSLALLFGTLLIFTLYLDTRRPNLRVGLINALTLMPRYVLAVLFVSVPVYIGLVLLVLPGIYALGRLMLTTPSLVANRSGGVLAALGRSVALSSGHGMILAGFACITLFGGRMLAMPFDALGKTLDGAPLANPFVAAMLHFGSAAGLAAGALAAILIEISLYRRLAASKGI
jgi:hypothetical protein